MTTLQDILDAVGTVPERYGRGAWFTVVDSTLQPWCPLAVDVLGTAEYHDHRSNITMAAAALGCGAKDVQYFIDWWDSTLDFRTVECRNRLEMRGYRVPPDAVRTRAKKKPYILTEDTP